MPVNLPLTSLGVAPVVAPALDRSPTRGRPGTLPGGLAGTAFPKAPGTEAVRPRNLTDLPRDVLKNWVADRLPPADAARLATVNRGLRDTMADYMEGKRATVDKVRQMACESLKDQPDALNAAFVARDRLPPHERGGLMTHFAQMLDQAATPEALTHVLDHLYEASQGLVSPARADMLAMMSARIDRLPLSVQTAAFSMLVQQTINVLDKADMLAPLQALAGQIHVFPANQRLAVMGVLAYQNKNNPDPVLAAKTLHPLELARLLPTLSEAIHSFEGEQRVDAFNFLRGMAQPLPAALRLPALQAFSQQIHLLPEEQRAESLWVNRCEIQSASSDPLLGARVALKAAGEMTMPHEDRAWLLGSIVHTSGELPEGPRATLLGEVRQVVAGAQWPGAEDVRQRLDATGY